MAQDDRDPSQPRAGEDSEMEHERVRSSNDRDASIEREGLESEHNRGYDEAVRGSERSGDRGSDDVDPDSADSEIDRDDMIDDI